MTKIKGAVVVDAERCKGCGAVRGRLSDEGSRVERRGQRQGLSFLADGFARGLYGLRFLRERLSR